MSEAHLMTLFNEALERTDPAERAAYLDTACGDDGALRRRVEALLAAHEAAGRFLEPDATEILESLDPSELATGDHRPAGTFDRSPRAESRGGFVAGQVIAGRYTLLDVLGEGGMGTVYRADQTEPVKRQVALKLIKIGMDSRVVLARFDAERQALALMDHPNIARVFDGGTTEANQPFFVMELVAGEPITTYCDRKRLTVQARLELFVAVCQAVQHAHQKGIIHRDLKPGNVLVAEVDGRPTPKVIDFGVAKATDFKLTDQTLGDTGAIVGTPAYMSPEQADPSSMDIDTRTDVYALGVLLYELLAGSPPIDARQFKRGAILEMLRMVREVDPPRPSTKVSSADALPNIAASRAIDPTQLKRELRGDLDWIVMKALEKDRTRRYDTANGFAADVLRHLAFEPVQAAPPSRAYRLRKFVRKNRGAVIAASLVLVALLAGIAGTTWGLILADRALAAEARRVKERDAALEVAERARDAEARRVTERDEALKKEAERAKERDAALIVADARAEELKHRLGVSEMFLAGNAYYNGDVVLAAQRLDKVPEEQRGWEWHYLKRRIRGGLFTLYGHTGTVWSASFSPDGSRIVTASEDETARVWEARTGTTILELKGHTDGVKSASFSPDGSRIVTASADKTARVWDARTGAFLFRLKGHRDGVWGASFSPDGWRIVTASADRTARVWDARTGATLLELSGHTDAVESASFSPDGSRILTASDDSTARVWDARTGALLLRLKGHKAAVWSASFSPDGSRILTASDDDTPRVWDARTGTTILELEEHLSEVSNASFSPDGSKIITADVDDTGRVWDARTGAFLLELQGHTDGVEDASFSPDGLLIVTASDDNTAMVWDARTGTTLLELKGHTDEVWNASFSPDGSRIATASADRTARVWDARTGTTLLELKGHVKELRDASFSPNGATIVTASRDKTARVWDARTGAFLLELKGHINEVWSASFSADGSRIITGSGDWSARVWDTRSGTSLLKLNAHARSVSAVSYSPDGSRILTASDDGTARVWDTRTDSSLLELKGHTDEVESVSFSPDGSRVVTASHDRTARVWDARTGTSLLELKGHTEGVESASFSLDGLRIVTRCHDKTARVWDARTGEELRGEPVPTESSGGPLSPDGRFFAHIDGDHVEIVSMQPNAEEREYRRFLTRPNFARYREGYDEARRANDSFAARFYLNLLPPAEREQLEAIELDRGFPADPFAR